ncbi:MAG: winged helix-turn-helix domain-containing protein [Hyphomicrobiales bacterium]|nr:winged helix-turn-helix domain-containing protein [Hyphomicrobiales bacterium]
MTTSAIRKDSVYKTDAEIAALVGLPKKDWQAAAEVLERGGLPMPDPPFANRRYWPAVRAFLDRRHGLDAHSPFQQPDGEENWDAINTPVARRARRSAA